MTSLCTHWAGRGGRAQLRYARSAWQESWAGRDGEQNTPGARGGKGLQKDSAAPLGRMGTSGPSGFRGANTSIPPAREQRERSRWTAQPGTLPGPTDLCRGLDGGNELLSLSPPEQASGSPARWGLLDPIKLGRGCRLVGSSWAHSSRAHQAGPVSTPEQLPRGLWLS